MPETFYHMKDKLSFPLMAGGIRRMLDLHVLTMLNKDEVLRYDVAALLLSRMTEFDGRRTAIAACEKMRDMHRADAEIIDAFLRDRGME